jgi:type VI protein secretion system component VasK
MYRPDGSGPSLMITMRPILSDEVPSVVVNLDGQAARFNRSSVAAKRLTWNGAEAQLAILSAQLGGREREILTFPGTWAVFRLFQLADWMPGEGSYSVRWRLPGVTATGAPLAAVFDVTLGGAKPVLRRDFFSGVGCSGRIVR